MNRRAFLLGMGTVTLGGSALVASGAYTRAESQRNVTIDVVGDEDAYLRLVYSNSIVECEGRIVLVELTNQFKDEITDIHVEFDGTSDDVTLGALDVPDSLAVGESQPVFIDVECASDDAVTTVTFDVEVSGPELAVRARDREIQIACSCLERFDARSISFVAFCWRDGVGDVTDVTVTHVNEDGEPTGVGWVTSQPVSEVILKGGREWYLYRYPGGATSGSGVTMDASSAHSVHSGQHPFRFENSAGEPIDSAHRCPQSPCAGTVGSKIDEENGEFDLANLETTKEDC